MIVCPLCNGFKSVPSAKIDPQNVREYDVCPACKGTGEVEEVKTKRPIITIYKAHGIYASDEVWEKNSRTVVDENIGAWCELSANDRG